LQLNVSDVHIRYEDTVTNPSCPFSFGVVIKKLSAQSTDSSWVGDESLQLKLSM